jgi:hypothetical protein
MSSPLKFFILISLFFVTPCLAQTTVFEQEEILELIKKLPPLKAPSNEAVSTICSKVRKGDLTILEDFRTMAGVTVNDNKNMVKAKVQRLWNTHFDRFGCSDEGLNLNVLKIALYNEHDNIIDLLVNQFNIDINLTDPADKKTLYEFSRQALGSMTQPPYTITKRITYFENVVEHLSKDLNAKRAEEYTSPTEQQQIDSIIKTLPPLKQPPDDLWAKLCYRVDAIDVWYKKDLEELAGVLKTDSKLMVKAKVQRLWNTQLVNFGCDSSGFSVEYGNILKFAIHKGYSEFIDSVINNYGLNINKKDPSDGKTVLDFVKDEIARWGKLPGQKSKSDELLALYKHLRNNLGAKYASELK